MPNYVAIYEDVAPSRTPSKRIKVIEAKDITDARKQANNDPEVVWGYQKLVSVESEEDYFGKIKKEYYSQQKVEKLAKGETQEIQKPEDCLNSEEDIDCKKLYLCKLTVSGEKGPESKYFPCLLHSQTACPDFGK